MITLIGYGIVCLLAYLIFAEEPGQTIDMISIKKDYARVLTETETIDIPFYITSSKSFMTDTDNVIDARILSEHNEVSVSIQAFKHHDTQTLYEGKTYHLYYISLDFSSIYTKHLQLDFPSASLVITYQNDDSIELDLGHMNILFHDLDQANHLDLKRMYSIQDNDLMTGLYLELDNQTGQTIIIHSIKTLNQHMLVNINHAREIYFYEGYIDSIFDVYTDYEPIIQSDNTTGALVIHQDTNLILPINYLLKESYLNRFPLVIEYTYQEKHYTYIIDDYLFYEHISDFYEDLHDIETYQYHYQ